MRCTEYDIIQLLKVSTFVHFGLQPTMNYLFNTNRNKSIAYDLDISVLKTSIVALQL